MRSQLAFRTVHHDTVQFLSASRLGLALLWLAALSGCVRTAAPPPLSFALPASYTEPTAADQPADLARWWLLFNDAQLTSLIDIALVHAPDIKIARARLAAVQAERSRALRQFDPQGKIAGSAVWENQQVTSGDVYIPNLPINVPSVALGNIYSETLGFNVAWEADLFGRKRAAGVVAAAQTDEARYDLLAAHAAVAANVADALFRARYQAGELIRAQDRLAADQAEADAMKLKVAAGLAPAIDQTARTLQANASAARVASAQATLAETKREILLLIGQGTESLDRINITPTLPELPHVPASAPAQLLVRRPDVGQAHAGLVKALGQQTQARLDLYPDFQIAPGLSLNGAGRPGAAYSTGIWSLGLSGLMPILDRGRLLAAVRASNARLTQAIDTYEKTVQTAFGETDSTLIHLAADTARWRLFAQSADAARAQAQALSSGIDAGVTDPAQWRSAMRQQDSAQTDAEAAHLQALRRTIQAFKALGGGWDDSAAIAGAANDRHHAGSQHHE